MTSRAQLGQIGEEMAVRHLQRAGVEILARNWRCATSDVRGELDIVAREGCALVFCEVKTRRSQVTGGPAAAVTPAKQARLRKLASAFLAAHPRNICDIRFDVVAISWPPHGGPPVVDHLRGVC